MSGISLDFKQILEIVPVGIFILKLEDPKNLEFRNVYVNQTNCDIVGADLKPFIGLTLRETFPTAYDQGFPQKYKQCIDQNKPLVIGEVTYGDENVQPQLFYLEVQPIGNNMVMLTTENITKLNKVTKELTLQNQRQTDKNKELQELSFLVSHDLKSPTNTISMAADLLQEDFSEGLDETGKSLVSTILGAAQRMRNLITHILEYSVIGKGKKKETVYLQNVLKNCLANLEAEIKASKAKITFNNLPDTVFGFSIELEQLFQNLLSNSIKYRDKNRPPEIHISAERKDHLWQFCVTDNGSGMTKPQQEQVFNIFQRLAQHSEFEGQGIGLAHCKKIVELHGGSIWVDSEPDKGSKFYFTIRD